MKHKKSALMQSVIALLLCVSMLVGTTFAWFTDSVVTGINTIAAGNLDVELYHTNAVAKDEKVDASTDLFRDLQGDPILWEPGVVSYENLRVVNEGSLALAYQMAINTANENYVLDPSGAQYGLSQILKVGVVEDGITATDRAGVVASVAEGSWTTLADFLRNGSLLPEDGENEKTWGIVIYWEPGENDNLWNLNNGKTLSEGEELQIDLGISLIATQEQYESDAFGSDYDSEAKAAVFPEFAGGTADADVAVDGANLTTAEVTMTSGAVSAVVPAGVKVAAGASKLTLTVTPMDASGANISLGDNEDMRSLDVHIEGVDPANTTPIVVTLKEVAPTGLNMGNYKLYHVENGATNEMTLLDSAADFTAHNQFKYDPATGDIVLYMATFSEVALVAEPAKWKGEFDYEWYNADAKELIIANADQLAAFGAIVGGMKKVTDRNEDGIYTYADPIQDSFNGKTVKLISDINLGDAEGSENAFIFYPIGYYNSEGTYERTNTAITSGLRIFEGTFDGQGHTIANFYQNTWEMKGDHNWYSPEEQYYRDGMGLFGKVYGGTVKNLTIDNFKSDGEIATTGCVAAYADFGATFENIAIFDCNPRVYNIGNGGIVGCVGWYTEGETDKKVTFKNITVDNSNKISALWGSYDVACGGIVGQYYPTSGQTGSYKNAGIDLVNCHVAAQMDVYNDVCGNYQYYAYRYAGMMIGSIRENTTTVIDGVTKTIPDMTGITATGCTVNYGDWNDYYYCEFVKNGHPSYSGPNDYKFSRVPDSELDFTDSNGNGKVDADERASVKGCNHDHNDVEDNQAIYLPFHQLFTGYGWGVNSIGLKEYGGITIEKFGLDIGEGDQEESVEKFEVQSGNIGNENGTTTINGKPIVNGANITVGDLFKAKSDIEYPIKNETVKVFVSPIGDDSTVAVEYTANATDWTQGTVTFSGSGSAEVIITDYNFCKETKLIISIGTSDKYKAVFDTDPSTAGVQTPFLYRVGNLNAVKVSSLFAAINNEVLINSANVEITIDSVDNSAATGEYSANKSNWQEGTIDFENTGLVKVTIAGDNGTPVELYLEVVDATNLTSATGTTTGGNFVLLCNVDTSTYVNYWNCTLYGNGFTYSLKGAPTAYNSKQGKGIIITKNTTLDNLVIIGDVYTGYGAYTNNDYYNTAIDVTGDTIIQNCYIANCAAPIRARNNVTIINTTLYGGTVANLIIEAETTTLENVTTANYDDGRELVGMGILIHSDATESAKLILNGTLTQYNFLSESKVPTDTYAKNLHDAMFSSDCSQYQFGTSPNRYVNTGVVSLTSTFNGEDITDNAKTGYAGKSLRVSTYDGYVYTQPNTSGSVNNNSDQYKPTTQGAVPPSYSFDFTNKNYIAKTDGSNDHCYFENGKVNISMDAGDTFNWDTSILTIGKGITNYTVSMNGTDYTGKSIAFNTAGDYTVTYTYTDDNNIKFDENGNITTYSMTYTKNVYITVAVVEAATKHAEFTFGSSNTASKTVTVGNNTYVMPNVSGTSSAFGSTTVSGQTIYYPIVEIIMSDNKTTHSSGWYAYFPVFSEAVTITDYADKGTGDKMDPYNGSTTTMPSGLSVVGDAKTLFKYQSGSNAGESPVVKNGKLVYSSAKIEADRKEYNTVVQYSYQDNAGSTYYYYIGYHAQAQTYSPGCFTPDTLVTLADGTQKRMDELSFDDKILAWDFFTGDYVEKGISLLVNHGEALYKIANLRFSDGTMLRLIAEHGVFDYDLNKFVYITVDNMQEYVGHRFVKYAADGSYSIVKLSRAYETEEYTSAWSVSSAVNSNAFASGLLTVAPPEDFYNWIEMDGKLHYDVAQFQQDVKTYGLYTYDDFEDYVTYEQFVNWNGAYLKIAVEKGYFTFDYILELIELYKGWMPNN